MKATAVGTSHAKIILIGEHSVVYQQPAIALPVSTIAMRATITRQSKQILNSRYFDGDFHQASANLAGIRQLVATLLSRFDQPDAGFDLQITSDIPAERGMGSSAAAAVAVTRAFYDYFDRPLDRQTLLKTANIAESITHGQPSGIDVATTSASQPVWFERNKANYPISVANRGFLVIADTGIKSQTKTAVANVRRQMELSPETVLPRFEQLGRLTVQVRDALSSGDLVSLGAAMDAAQIELTALGVSHPELARLIQVALANGALGAKLTGSGQGGCLIALSSTQAGAKVLAAKLVAAGATATWIEPLGQA